MAAESDESHSPARSESARRVVRVSGAMVAAARAQVTLSGKLGKPIPKVIAKIAEAQRR